MRILELSARNVSGLNFSDALGRVTVYAGPNFRGKTTRINALALALAQEVPGVAKSTRDVFENFSPDSGPMSAACVTDSGLELGCEWRLKRGAVSAELKPDSKQFNFPMMVLDPNLFLSMTGGQRLQFLFERASAAGLSVGAVADQLAANLKNVKLERSTPATERALAELAERLHVSARAAAAQGLNAQQYVNSMADAVKELRLKADQNARRMQQTLAGMAQVAADAGAAPHDAERRLAAARAELERLTADQAAARERHAASVRDHRAAAELASRAKPADEAAAEIRELTELLEVERDVPEPEPADQIKPMFDEATQHQIEDLQRVQSELRRATESPRRNALPAAEAVRSASQALADRRVESAKLKAERDRITGSIAEARTASKCAHCGQSIVHIQAAVIEVLTDQRRAASEKYEAAGAAEEAAAEKLRVAETNHAEVMADVNAWDDAHSRLQATDSQLDKIRRRADQEARSDWDRRFRQRQDAQARARSYAARIEALRAASADPEVARASAELPSLLNACTATAAELDGLSQRVAAGRCEVAKADGWVREVTRVRSEEAARERAREAAAEAKAELDLMSQAVELISALQLELVDRVVGPLIATANRLGHDVLTAPLAYRDGDVGLDRRGERLVKKTMSGCERAVSYCALSLALAADAPVRIAVIDELDRLDADNKLKLVLNILTLVDRGELDQAILADVSPGDYRGFLGHDGFKLIEL